MNAGGLARDAAISFSLANILFLRRWMELFAVAEAQSYYLKVTPADFAGTVLAFLFVGVLFTAGAQLRHAGITGRRVASLAFGFVLVLLANYMGTRKRQGLLGVYVGWTLDPPVALLQTVLAVAGLVVLVLWWRVVRTVAMRALLVLFPFAVLVLARTGWNAYTVDLERFADRAPPLSSAPVSGPGPRVVVLLFDALGRALAFDQRPEGVAMPAFDRLRAESVDAIAVRRAGEHTREAVPGIFSGIQPVAARPSGPDTLLLELGDGRVVSWTSLPNAFDAAQEAGGSATIAGWYHPYCRLFPTLDGCSSYPGSTCGGQVEWSVRASFFSALRGLSPFTIYRDRHVRAYRALMQDATFAVTRPGRGLTYVHLPVPHFPTIWDRREKKLTAFNFSPNGYVDQLELADHALAELRSSMEKAGTWDSSTVLVVSDHPSSGATRRFRLTDQDVPFLLKLPGQTTSLEVTTPFSAATAYPLMRELLAGTITSPEEAVAWLESNALPADEPVLAKTHKADDE